MTTTRSLAAVIAALLLTSFSPGAFSAGDSELLTAARLVESGASGGVIGVVGDGNAQLAVALGKLGSFVVHVLATTPEGLVATRKAIQASGMYGDVSAALLTPGCLPYAENLLNFVIVPEEAALLAGGIKPSEVFRVLAPLGSVCVRLTGASAKPRGNWTLAGARTTPVDANGPWLRVQKPWPKEIDQWTHFLHAADGNPVANDSVVAPPERYQWIAPPLWLRSHETDSSISTIVTAAGRLFYIIDEGPISVAGQHDLPDEWKLVARDAFNGRLLWKVPIRRWGWREWKDTWFTNRPGDFPFDIRKRLVASEDHVYVTLGYRAPVSQLDARTGQLLQTYDGTNSTGEILYRDGTLIVSVRQDDKLRVATLDAKSGRLHWLSKGDYQGSRTDYVKFNSRYAKLNAPQLEAALNLATDGKTIALIDGAELVGLDYATGIEKWRASFPTTDADRRAGGIQAGENLWNGCMIVTGGVVIHASPFRVAALDANTGKLLWDQPKDYIGHLWYEWKEIFVIDGVVWTWGEDTIVGKYKQGNSVQRSKYPQTVKGYDLKTGALVKQVPLGPIFFANHHHRCYRDRATTRYILASRRGTEYVDLVEGKHSVHNWVRGTCHVGMFPANGLQYAPPHPCQCYIEEKLSGFNALAPGPVVAPPVQPTAPLTRGPAFGKPGAAAPAGEEDWPTFRHDAGRSGAGATALPAVLKPAWQVALGGRLSAPVAAADQVFVSQIDQHQVVCLDATAGKEVWRVTAGGRVDSPPTYHDGLVLFGSADGSVYCVRSGDGALVWRFRAAPYNRLIGAFDQLESAWPVSGSVLVLGDTAYFAAGRSSELDGGIHLYGVAVHTGEVRYHRVLSGPDYVLDPSGTKLMTEDGQQSYEVNFRLPTGSLPDVLASDGEKLYMRTAAFDKELRPTTGTPQMQARYGLLEDSYFKRTPWTFEGQYSRLLVHNKSRAFYIRQFDTLRGLDPTVYFTPGAKGYLLFAKDVGGKQNAWMERVPIRIRAMALTANRLIVAGPPDEVDPKDPLGAFEGRKGGLLSVIDAASGEKAAEHPLQSPPVFNGLAAARGRLFVVSTEGSVTCFGG